MVEAELVMPGEGLAEGIKRAGADIAEHDADRANGELDQTVIAMGMRVPGVRVIVAPVGYCDGRSGRAHGSRRAFARKVMMTV